MKRPITSPARRCRAAASFRFRFSMASAVPSPIQIAAISAISGAAIHVVPRMAAAIRSTSPSGAATKPTRRPGARTFEVPVRYTASSGAKADNGRGARSGMRPWTSSSTISRPCSRATAAMARRRSSDMIEVVGFCSVGTQ
jgi:hypothetical protein